MAKSFRPVVADQAPDFAAAQQFYLIGEAKPAQAGRSNAPNNAEEPPPPPSVDLDSDIDGVDYGVGYIENDTGVPIGSGITITAAGPTIDGATVTLTNGQAGDELVFTGTLPDGIILTASAGVLQFSGNATLADYEAVLAGVRYFNTTDDPTLGGNTERVITVTVSDDYAMADSATATATITITALNDPAMLGGDTAGQATENDIATLSGTISCTDPDSGESRVQAQLDVAGTYGSFSIAENGQWTYTPNDNDFLRGGQQVTDIFTVRSFDDTATLDVVITISGLNDVPTVFADGGTGDVTEGDPLANVAAGALVIADPDAEESFWAGVTTVTTYGTFNVQDDGSWTYTLNNASAATRGLAEGQIVHDMLEVFSHDGTASLTLDVTIHGVNHIAELGGARLGDVTEDTSLVATGQLTISDADAGENQVQPIAAGTAGANGYGSFEVRADGSWTYQLNNSLAAVQALNGGDTLTDTILVTSRDGTATETISVTIHGRDAFFPSDQPPEVGETQILIALKDGSLFLFDKDLLSGHPLELRDAFSEAGIMFGDPAQDSQLLEDYGLTNLLGGWLAELQALGSSGGADLSGHNGIF